MRSVEDAIELVLEHAGRQPAVSVPLDQSLGLTLASDVQSDIDSPPFDKALMDGFAVRSEDLIQGKGTFAVVETLAAGAVSSTSLSKGAAARIMTGAPMPAGSDSVVMVERSTPGGPDRVQLDDPGFRRGQNVMLRATELTRDQLVLRAGDFLSPASLGLLATVGVSKPLVRGRVSISIISTGDEIVPVDSIPGPSQIRNSNESTLIALAQRHGAIPRPLGIVADRPDDLDAAIAKGLRSDILVLSGGVSMGERDFVPDALKRHGVVEIFHKVELKPGKPVWFGRHEQGLVFGLPGNPVSVLVCFELFVATALRARLGRSRPQPQFRWARLASDFAYPTGRVTYHPALVDEDEAGAVIKPLPWSGSPDLKALSHANALIVIPVNRQTFAEGTKLRFLSLEG